MRKIVVFNMVSVDDYFEGENHDLSWHHVDSEFGDFAVEQLKEFGTILFGKTTYQLMESYWSSEVGTKDDPQTAELMNTMPKVAVSTTLSSVQERENWKNVKLISRDVENEIKKLKEEEGLPIILLGSNKLLVSLMKLNLIDELRIMVNPVILGKGTRLFENYDRKLNLKLEKLREFKNGNVLLYYTKTP